MTQREPPSAAADGTSARGGMWAGIRVALLAAALGCGALAYHDHFLGDLPWWRWIIELLAGCVLLTLGLRTEGPPTEHAGRRWSRRTFGALAVIAMAVAIHLFPQLGREVATGVALSVAVVAFLLARWLPFAPEDVRALIGDATEVVVRHPPFTIARAAVGLASLAAGIAAAAVNPSHHLAAFGLWLASMTLFAAACWQRSRAAQPALRWVEQAGPSVSRRTEALLLALILLLALAFRATFLADVPAVIDPDEGRQGRYAERIWQNGFPDAFEIGWNVFPNLSYMVEYAWVQALGTSNSHLRLAAATIGVLSLVPAFFWVRRWWGNAVALLAVFLLATNWEHSVWSRLALNNIQQVLVAGLMLATFARVLHTQRWIDWVWFGYATGLAFHTYHAAKLFPALLAAAAMLFALGMCGFTRRYLGGALVGALAFLLCFGPLMVTIYQKWEQFYASTSNRTDLARLTEAYGQGDTREVRNYLSSHVLGCLFSFVSSPAHRAATFDSLVAVPFLLGVGWMLWYWRDPRHLVVLVWIAGILAIGGMITDYPPWKARLLGDLPAAVVIPAVVVGRIRGTLFRCFPKRADLIVAPLLVLWLTGAAYQSWDTLFFYWPSLQRGDFMTEICRVINETRLPATFYMARGAEVVDPKLAMNDCMIAPAPNRFVVDLPDDPAIVPIPPTNRGTAVLLVAPYQQELVPLILHYYPQARYDVVRNSGGGTILHVFRLTEDEIHRTRGLRATYRSPSRTWSTDLGSAALALPSGVDFPLSVTWRGQVWIGGPGAYGFRASGATLRVDDTTVAGEETRTLAAGWHPIELSATFDAPHPVAAEWKLPDTTQWAAIPHTHLQTHPQSHGLLGRYFGRVIETAAATPIAAPADYTRIDNAVSFDFQPQWDDPPPGPFAARPSTMEWTGTVEFPEGNGQVIRLEATTPTQVFVDGRLVLTTTGRRDEQRVDASLSGLTGRVPLLVRSVRPADDNWNFWKLRLLWQEPGGGWTAFALYRPDGSSR